MFRRHGSVLIILIPRNVVLVYKLYHMESFRVDGFELLSFTPLQLKWFTSVRIHLNWNRFVLFVWIASFLGEENTVHIVLISWSPSLPTAPTVDTGRSNSCYVMLNPIHWFSSAVPLNSSPRWPLTVSFHCYLFNRAYTVSLSSHKYDVEPEKRQQENDRKARNGCSQYITLFIFYYNYFLIHHNGSFSAILKI